MKKIVDQKLLSFKALGDPPVIPADFLIDRRGNILIANYGKDYADSLEIEDILNYLSYEYRYPEYSTQLKRKSF